MLWGLSHRTRRLAMATEVVYDTQSGRCMCRSDKPGASPLWPALTPNWLEMLVNSSDCNERKRHHNARNKQPSSTQMHEKGHTHTRVQIHTRARANARAHTHPHTHTYIRKDTQRPAHTHARGRARRQTRAHPHTRNRTQTHARAHSRARTHAHLHTHARAHSGREIRRKPSTCIRSRFAPVRMTDMMLTKSPVQVSRA